MLLGLLLLLHLLGSGVIGLGGRYRLAVDDCISNGTRVTNGDVIHEGLLTNGTCAFLMTGNPHIVVQPLKLNLNESTVIKLYSISRNGTWISKHLITKYSGRYLYNNLIFMARTNDEFALVVLSRKNGSIGNFSFVFRTYCFAEVISENYPSFSSPNMGYGNGLSANEVCQYNVYSSMGERYTIKFGSINLFLYPYSFNYDSLTINGRNDTIYSNQMYTYNSTNKTEIVLRSGYYGWFGLYRGFNATVQPVQSIMRLKQYGNKNMTGDVQVKFDKDWYYIQMFPGFNIQYYATLVNVFYSYMNPINNYYYYNYNNYYYYYYDYFTSSNWIYGYAITDAHVMCRDAGYTTVERMDSHPIMTTTDRLMAHGFWCRGDERKLSQCVQTSPSDLQHLTSYSSPQSVLKLTCTDQMKFRLSNGDYGDVQVSLLGTWSMICSDNMDVTAADVLCQEMGFTGVRSVLQSSYNNYYYYYNYYSNVIMRNIRCGESTKIKDCSYQLSSNNYGYCIPLRLSCTSKDQLSLIGGLYENGGYIRRNQTLACLDNFDKLKAGQVCQDMGYPGVLSPTFTNSSFNSASYSIRPLSCNESSSNGSKCTFDLGASCPSGKAAGVICQNVALAGSNRSDEGRVEVYHSGRKGLLCDDYFSVADGDVICRQLGFDNSVETYQRAGGKYGYGNGMYLLRNLYCNGSESSINNCYNYGWMTNDCSGYEVAGVVCNRTSLCGIKSIEDIINGSSNGYETVAYSYPWHAHIFPDVLSPNWCSGTILNRYWVLTSASCIIGPYRLYYIEGGKHSIEKDRVEKYEVANVITHPDYSTVTEDNNIALVKMKTPFSFDGRVRQACLQPMNQTLQNMRCVTTGWGHQEGYGNLMAKPVQIQNQSYCMINTGFDSIRMQRSLCFDNNIGTSAVFNGESGGPLTCSYNGQSTVVGIMARSILGARSTRIGLFTRVEYYVDWITTTMNSNA